jgi:hypothetical protein
MKTLALAMVMAILATSAALAGDGGPTNAGDNNGRSHASAAPACAATSRSQKEAHADRLFGDGCRVLASEGPPTTAGDHNGRSAG